MAWLVLSVVAMRSSDRVPSTLHCGRVAVPRSHFPPDIFFVRRGFCVTMRRVSTSRPLQLFNHRRPTAVLIVAPSIARRSIDARRTVRPRLPSPRRHSRHDEDRSNGIHFVHRPPRAAATSPIYIPHQPKLNGRTDDGSSIQFRGLTFKKKKKKFFFT